MKAPDSFVTFCYRCGAKLIIPIKNPYLKVKKPGLSNGKLQVSSQMLSNAIGDVWMDGKEWDMAIKDNTCGSCGRNNCRDSRYCDSCGSRLNIQCMVCSSEQNPIHAKFCLQCGTALMDGVNLLSDIQVCICCKNLLSQSQKINRTKIFILLFLYENLPCLFNIVCLLFPSLTFTGDNFIFGSPQ